MPTVTLQAVATPNKSLIGTNCIYAAAADIAALGIKDGGHIQVKSMVFKCCSDAGARPAHPPPTHPPQSSRARLARRIAPHRATALVPAADVARAQAWRRVRWPSTWCSAKAYSCP
jgi:hypothetical protein